MSLKQSTHTQRLKDHQQKKTERYGQEGLSEDRVRRMIGMIMCPPLLWLQIGGRPLPLIIWVSRPGASGPTWRGSTSQTHAQTVDFKGSQSLKKLPLIKRKLPNGDSAHNLNKQLISHSVQ